MFDALTFLNGLTMPDNPEAVAMPDVPQAIQDNAPRPDGPSVGGEQPTDKPPPSKWVLDDMDRAVLLACGVIPTPSPANLPAEWQRHYRGLTDKLIRLGVLVERAEAMVLRDTLERMLACDELIPEGW